MEPAHVKDIVEEATLSCEGFETSGALLSTNKINPNLTVLAAPAELASVIANMIQNAYRFVIKDQRSKYGRVQSINT